MAKGKFSLNFAAIEALFKPKMPPLIGADISSSAVKMVEIVDAGKGAYRLERYAIEPLPTESVVEGNINNLDAVIEAVKRCHKRLGSNFKNLALALPNAAVISKKILLPAGQNDDDLEGDVEREANQYIPFSLDEVNLDYQVVGPAPNSPEDIEVLIAASRKDKIEDRVAVAEGAGLKALVMDVDLFAAQSAFELIEATMPERGRDLNIAVVDIGGIYTQDERSTTTKVPLLGDLPYVGFLFKNNQRVDDRRELLIFISPKILKDGASLR